MSILVRYWIEFSLEGFNEKVVTRAGVRRGCGVTAYTEEDAIHILKTEMFSSTGVPKIKLIKANIDVNTLEEKHVRPNMGVVSNRGIWFPFRGV